MTDDLSALPERIVAKLHYEPNTGCLLWTGAASKGGRCGGYGSVKWQGSMRQAHRVVFELLVRDGERLPPELTLDHVKAARSSAAHHGTSSPSRARRTTGAARATVIYRS